MIGRSSFGETGSFIMNAEVLWVYDKKCVLPCELSEVFSFV